MTTSGWDRESSPFHDGERALHARLGKSERMDDVGRRVIRPFMPDQHRTFFHQLPYIIMGSVDGLNWPWASMLFGPPGFVSTPTNKTMMIEGGVVTGDPVAEALIPNAPVSLVGIEFETRRRNRVNGIVSATDQGRTKIDIVQSFGNCPQYIFTRDPNAEKRAANAKPDCVTFTDLDRQTADLIASADTFFVASHNPNDDPRDTGGVDVNHRGGQPGFVKVAGNTLTVPDFLGNFSFNTLGNFVVNPKAGLLFIDFDHGDLVQMTGTVDLDWEPTEEVSAFKGAQRSWRFHLDHGQRLIGAAPVRWRGGEPSPVSLKTGAWG